MVKRPSRQTVLHLLLLLVTFGAAAGAFFGIGVVISRTARDYDSTSSTQTRKHPTTAYRIDFTNLHDVPVDPAAIERVADSLSQPQAVASDGTTLFVATADDTSLYRFNEGGRPILVTDNLAPVFAMVVENDRLVIPVPSEHRVVTVNRQSGQVKKFVDKLDAPTGITKSRDGNYYVTDAAAGTVLKLLPDGTVSTVADGLAEPRGIVVDNDNIIRVAQHGDSDNSVIQIQDNGRRSTVVHGLVGASALYYDTLKDLMVGYSQDGQAGLDIYYANGDLKQVLVAGGAGTAASVVSDGKYVYFATGEPGSLVSRFQIP